jgi:hypothetical protein
LEAGWLNLNRGGHRQSVGGNIPGCFLPQSIVHHATVGLNRSILRIYTLTGSKRGLRTLNRDFKLSSNLFAGGDLTICFSLGPLKLE